MQQQTVQACRPTQEEYKQNDECIHKGVDTCNQLDKMHSVAHKCFTGISFAAA